MDMEAYDILYRVFHPPDPTRPRSLFMALHRGLVPKRFMQEARRILQDLESQPRRPRTALPMRGWKGDAGPSWDNVVRALEDG